MLTGPNHQHHQPLGEALPHTDSCWFKKTIPTFFLGPHKMSSTNGSLYTAGEKVLRLSAAAIVEQPPPLSQPYTSPDKRRSVQAYPRPAAAVPPPGDALLSGVVVRQGRAARRSLSTADPLPLSRAIPPQLQGCEHRHPRASLDVGICHRH